MLTDRRGSTRMLSLELGTHHEEHIRNSCDGHQARLSMNPAWAGLRDRPHGCCRPWPEQLGRLRRRSRTSVSMRCRRFLFDSEGRIIRCCSIRMRLPIVVTAGSGSTSSPRRLPATGAVEVRRWYRAQSEGWMPPILAARPRPARCLVGAHADRFAVGRCARPVVHVSHYEADAFATWSRPACRLSSNGKRCGRLGRRKRPREQRDDFTFTPSCWPATGGLRQLFGDCWEWTSSAYQPYPGFSIADGAIGEYNGKFMSGQQVLRGGCVFTPPGHTRSTYRNFFHPHTRWHASGVRLATDRQ